MKKYLLVWTLLFSTLALAEEGSVIALEKAPVDINDINSIKRGAKFFAANCMACHTLIYMRYNRVAREAGILYDKMPINVTNWPYGVKPPDLSLIANVRGPDWLYTYLHSFYTDSARPTGFNNLVFPNTAMPGILIPFQGQLVRLPDEQIKKGIYDHQLQWYDVLMLKSQGGMTPAEFDKTVTDVVNFLVYAADPYKAEQYRIGKWVIFFLVIFSILLFFLKKEYWKELDRKRKE